MGPSFASPATCISEARSTRIPGTPHSRARSRRSSRRTLAAQQGTKVVVLLFPTKEEVYLPLLNQPVPRPAAPFAAELARRGIDYLDLTGTFTARARAGRSLYFELDPHPNQPGYTSPPARRQYATACRGNAAFPFLRVKRSSCAAATISPSRSREAALS